MEISLRDRPARASRTARRRGRVRVSSVVIALGVVSLLTDISSEAVSAVLPLYVTVALGFSTVAYGVLDGVMQGASALMRIAGGWAADKGDHPKWVAFAGYGLSALTRGGLLLVTGLVGLTSLVAADRIGKGLRTAPRDSMIASSTKARHLGRAFGVHRAFDTAGAAIGPLLAFAVLWAIPDGFTTVFLLSFVAAVIGLAVLGLFVPDVRPRRSALEAHRVKAETRGVKCVGCQCSTPALSRGGPRFSWRSLAQPRLRRVLLAAAVLGLVTVSDGFLYLALQSRDGFATEWFPLLYVGTNLAYMALAIPLGRVADRVGKATVFVVGHVALVAAYLAAASSVGGAAATIATLGLLGLFYAATDGVLAAVTGQLADTAVRGAAIGSAQTAVALARMFASFGFGALWYALGAQEALLVVAAALAALTGAFAVLVRPIDRHLASAVGAAS